MRLYDTLHEQKVELNPPDRVMRMYVCGITPYDTTHVGHARVNVVFDSMSRLLEHQGFSVRYVQNVTDIDDDVLRKAGQLGLTWDELGQRETERYLRDLDGLNVRRPTFYVKATETIPEMLVMIEDLVAKGYAYVSAGNVYFDVGKDPEFGALGHMGRDEMLRVANERGNHPDDPHKRDPLDFVLWQAMKPGEPSWESPWGPGRPGWHIECSAMVLKYLGPQIQIHGGGADLQFPHHAAEIAQTEHHTDQRPVVEAWAHVGMVRLNGEKMSKSLGNLVLAADLLKRYSADAIRLSLHRYHYRQEFEFKEADVKAAEATVARWRAALSEEGGGPQVGSLVAGRLYELALQALDDDFDTPGAIKLTSDIADGLLVGAIDDQQVAAEAIRTVGAILGLTLA